MTVIISSLTVLAQPSPQWTWFVNVRLDHGSGVSVEFCLLLELSIPGKVDVRRCRAYPGVVECRQLTCEVFGCGFGGPNPDSVEIQHR